MAAAGSALGSIVIYWIGYKGGEVLLVKRIGEERFNKIGPSFDKHEFLAIMLPSMLPPPTPFKLFVLRRAWPRCASPTFSAPSSPAASCASASCRSW